MDFSVKGDLNFTQCDFQTFLPLTTLNCPSWFNPIILTKDKILFKHATDSFKNKLNKSTDNLKTLLCHMLQRGTDFSQQRSGLNLSHITPSLNTKRGSLDVRSLSWVVRPSYQLTSILCCLAVSKNGKVFSTTAAKFRLLIYPGLWPVIMEANSCNSCRSCVWSHPQVLNW